MHSTHAARATSGQPRVEFLQPFYLWARSKRVSRRVPAPGRDEESPFHSSILGTHTSLHILICVFIIRGTSLHRLTSLSFAAGEPNKVLFSPSRNSLWNETGKTFQSGRTRAQLKIASRRFLSHFPFREIFSFAPFQSAWEFQSKKSYQSLNYVCCIRETCKMAFLVWVLSEKLICLLNISQYWNKKSHHFVSKID